MATGGYFPSTTTVSIKEARDRLTALVSWKGETVVVTRNGKPILDLVPHKKKGGLNFEALAEYKRKHGIDRFFDKIPEDFDDPLPEDFLIKPLPK